MQTKTDHTVTLSPEDTTKAVFIFLHEAGLKLPGSYAGLTIKWTSKGVATVSFSLGDAPKPEPEKLVGHTGGAIGPAGHSSAAVLHMTPSRADKERAAKQAGYDADSVFARLCNKLGLDIEVARVAPLLSIAAALAESRREPA